MKKILLQFIILLVTSYLALFAYGALYSDEAIFLPPDVSYQWSDNLVKIRSASTNDNHDPTSNGNSHYIVARYLINKNSDYTIVYSHGNASDLGRIKSKQSFLYNLGFSIIAYDYSGYGLSEGRPSEQQVYNDVSAVYDYLLHEKNLKPQQIISYGHSLGTAIATDLASDNPVAGLVLESPFVSAFRVQTTYPLLPFDKFSTIDIIDQINTPLFIVHSRNDSTIPIWHSEMLFDKAKQPKFSLWLDSGGHSSIYRKKQFVPAFKRFVSGLVNHVTDI
jgi:fermentation-respiration switch protein FrsA (DUF1100 family)